jgi:hypothetical protein
MLIPLSTSLRAMAHAMRLWPARSPVEPMKRKVMKPPCGVEGCIIGLLKTDIKLKSPFRLLAAAKQS